MTDPADRAAARTSSEASRPKRPASIRSTQGGSASPSPHQVHRSTGSGSVTAGSGQRSRLPSTDTPGPQAQSQSPPPPPPPSLPDESTIRAAASPPFRPFFTLVSDVRPGGATMQNHPRVHYVFADDDPEPLARALEASASASQQLGGERVVLVDLEPAGPAGYAVASAASLSPGWALTSARVSRMEGGDGGGGGGAASPPAQGDDAPLMLRIEGVGAEVVPTVSVRSSASSGEAESYDPIVEELERRMGMLRRVVEAGEERRRKTEEDREVTRRAETAAGSEDVARNEKETPKGDEKGDESESESGAGE
jgi:hypothetical protein